MRLVRRTATVAAAAASILALGAGSALAHECVNPDKKAGAGAQLLIDFTAGEDAPPTFLSTGLQKRFESGVTTQETFRGLVGLDFDGDGDADMTTWMVGKTGEIPMQAQEAGAACHGVLHFEAYFTCLEEELAG